MWDFMILRPIFAYLSVDLWVGAGDGQFGIRRMDQWLRVDCELFTDKGKHNILQVGAAAGAPVDIPFAKGDKLMPRLLLFLILVASGCSSSPRIVPSSDDAPYVTMRHESATASEFISMKRDGWARFYRIDKTGGSGGFHDMVDAQVEGAFAETVSLLEQSLAQIDMSDDVASDDSIEVTLHSHVNMVSLRLSAPLARRRGYVAHFQDLKERIRSSLPAEANAGIHEGGWVSDLPSVLQLPIPDEGNTTLVYYFKTEDGCFRETRREGEDRIALAGKYEIQSTDDPEVVVLKFESTGGLNSSIPLRQTGEGIEFQLTDQTWHRCIAGELETSR